MQDGNRRGSFAYFPDGSSQVNAEITTTAAPAVVLTRIPIPEDTTVTIRLEVAAHRRSNGDGAGYFIFVTFKRILAGNVVQVGATAAIATQEDDAAYAVTFTAGTVDVAINVASGGAFEVQWSLRANMLPCKPK